MSQQRRPRKRDNPRYVALRLLAVRPRTVGELKKRLRKKGFPELDVARVIDELQEQALIDDVRFAEMLIEHTTARKPVGRRLLQWKLRNALLSPELVEDALARWFPPERETALAQRALHAKLAELKRRRPDSSGEDVRGYLTRFLLARGFSSSLVHTVIEKDT